MTVTAVWRRTPRRSVTRRAPDDALLHTFHPSVLIGAALLVVTCRTLVLTSYDVIPGKDSITTAGIIGYAMAATCLVAGLLLLTLRAVTTLPGILGGLVILTAAPVIAQLGAADQNGARTAVALLLLPSVIAAATLPAIIYRTQVAVAAALAIAMTSMIATAAPVTARAIETSITVAVLVAGSLLVRRISTSTTRHLEQLQTLALTDTLTGTLNRRGLALRFDEFHHRTAKSSDIGVLMVDIDHFKNVNDTFGHAVGDDVLTRVSAALREAAGPDNLVARTGGEEFAAIVRGPARPVAERLRTIVATLPDPAVTVSVGIVDTRPGDATDDDALWHWLDVADHALYDAKNTGRDRICTGSLAGHQRVTAPSEPSPTTAAVEADNLDTFSPSPHLASWTLVCLTAVSLIWRAVLPPPIQGTAIGPLTVAVLFACVLLSALLFATTHLIEGARWFLSVVGSDLVIAMAIISITDDAARLTSLLPLLITGLMVAQYFRRSALLLHHLAILAMTLMALAPAMTTSARSTPAMVDAVVEAGIMIAIVELIFYLRQRNIRAAADLHLWSVTDPLTGLVNRRGLDLAFEKLSTAEQLAVLTIDVDDFKSINDTFGHAAGDDALTRLADTLRTVTGPDAVVARLGGDEFAALVLREHPVTLATRIHNAVTLLPIPLSVTVGPALATAHRLRSLPTLLARADEALTAAKQQRHREVYAAAADPVTDSDDGSSADTSTRTKSPSAMSPASSRFAI